ncbi:hypothetical protein BO78DRAFT_398381 [Aspergillus sclerotiicarbonarius CBS 121057]|uniref:Ribosomal protein S21 n=1 Tax=Aspergillus sclerotiicarbonarius (strain CBS 121057 / IBT 28362) TaxID=1448318 RepID=A0A319E765_ASPSB|nr:hypothetical protein BO78DRAFT_398381 [Aspergillus sclerotiicarbonarius CBS 121057]
MERRAIAQCLRSRPTTTLYKTQLLPGRIGLRFSSNNNNNNNNTNTTTTAATPPSPQAPTQTTTPSRTPNQPQTQPPAAATDFDQILHKLNINSTNNNTNSTPSANEQAPGSRVFNDPLSVSRAVGLSAETENLRSLRRVDLKLGPKLGRQIQVEPERGMDLPAALRSLTAVLNQNKVRASVQAQRFHVRKGQLRKTLRVKRWRNLFKFSFGATVKRIQKIRAQGW